MPTAHAPFRGDRPLRQDIGLVEAGPLTAGRGALFGAPGIRPGTPPFAADADTTQIPLLQAVAHGSWRQTMVVCDILDREIQYTVEEPSIPSTPV